MHSIDMKVCVLATISMLSLSISAMPPPHCLGLGVDFTTYPDGTNLACIEVSYSEVIHVSVMAHVSPSSTDCNTLTWLTISLACIRQHFMLIMLSALHLVASEPDVPLTILELIP